jgi:hypothetical protein
MPKLVLGPLLRYVGETQATVWVETDAAARVEVEVSPAEPGREAAGGGHGQAPTFRVHGHHYALVLIGGLEPDRVYTYRLELDGEQVWRSRWPPRTGRLPGQHHPHPAGDHPLRIAFGSCRSPPPRPLDAAAERRPQAGQGADALYAFALRMRDTDPAPGRTSCCCWATRSTPTTPPSGCRTSSARDATSGSRPALEVADFEEYTRLYWETWATRSCAGCSRRCRRR